MLDWKNTTLSSPGVLYVIPSYALISEVLNSAFARHVFYVYQSVGESFEIVLINSQNVLICLY